VALSNTCHLQKHMCKVLMREFIIAVAAQSMASDTDVACTVRTASNPRQVTSHLRSWGRRLSRSVSACSVPNRLFIPLS